MPNIAYASFDSVLTNINRMVINPIIDLLFALAVLFFLYGVFEFMTNQENEEKRTAGKQHMVWGVVGLAIMMGVFTLMNILLRTLDIKGINPEENKVDIQIRNQ